MTHHEHKRTPPTEIGVAVLTISDTRTFETDASGALVKELVTGAGHIVREYRVLKDEPVVVEQALRELTRRSDIRAIVLNGGTGISPRDRTFEAVSSLLERRLDGFGEIFRALSYQEIGSAAMLSRAVAGIVGDTVVFSVPGSTAAVRLALETLILPEIGHIVAQLDTGTSAGKGPERA
jgi:molybdenum cofactor biosynthesis protein B